METEKKEEAEAREELTPKEKRILHDIMVADELEAAACYCGDNLVDVTNEILEQIEELEAFLSGPMRAYAPADPAFWQTMVQFHGLVHELDAATGKVMKLMAATTGDVQRITLFRNNVITNDPCAICGNRTDPCGFDYGIGKRLVCDPCAKKHAPKLVSIQKEALDFAKMACDMRNAASELYAKNIRNKIRAAINEPVEKRIMKILDEVCSGEDDISF